MSLPQQDLGELMKRDHHASPQTARTLWRLQNAAEKIYLQANQATDVPVENAALLSNGQRRRPRPLLWIFGGAAMTSIIAATVLYLVPPDPEQRDASPFVATQDISKSKSVPFSNPNLADTSDDSVKATENTVAFVSPNGASSETKAIVSKDILLQNGHVAIDNKQAQWRVVAGPYSIQVLGARFEVDWNPKADALSLSVTEGHGWVKGPLVPNGINVQKDQQLTIDIEAQTVALSPRGTTASTANTKITSEGAIALDLPSPQVPGLTQAAPQIEASPKVSPKTSQKTSQKASQRLPRTGAAHSKRPP